VSLLLAVTGPPLLLSGLGLVNPAHLTAESADVWKNLHVVLLPVFPLLALAPWCSPVASTEPSAGPRSRWATASPCPAEPASRSCSQP